MQGEQMDLLKVYTTILDNCRNEKAIRFLVTRIYKILSKEFTRRKEVDFPKTSYNLQVVHLVAYLKEGKLAYAFLFASSLNNIIKQSGGDNGIADQGTIGIWGWLRAALGNLYIRNRKKIEGR
jgi:hypothetical protein